jgi:hypothetical protein
MYSKIRFCQAQIPKATTNYFATDFTPACRQAGIFVTQRHQELLNEWNKANKVFCFSLVNSLSHNVY